MKEIEGDLIRLAKENRFDCIVQGCNCFTVMGAGIAKTIRENFPEAYEADLKTSSGSYNKLGSLSIAKSNNGVYIVNAYTQFQPGPNANFTALQMCFDKIAYIMKEWGLKELGCPLIACGIGGLEENVVVPWIKMWSLLHKNDFSVTLVRFKSATSNEGFKK